MARLQLNVGGIVRPYHNTEAWFRSRNANFPACMLCVCVCMFVCVCARARALCIEREAAWCHQIGASAKLSAQMARFSSLPTTRELCLERAVRRNRGFRYGDVNEWDVKVHQGPRIN